MCQQMYSYLKRGESATKRLLINDINPIKGNGECDCGTRAMKECNFKSYINTDKTSTC